jgi:hypothetical protein
MPIQQETRTAFNLPAEGPRSDQKNTQRLTILSPHLYVILVILAGLCAGAYGLREYGIFSCPASGYADDRYLAYCGSTSFGDYDHGAFWFGLEPRAVEAARSADVLFIGNSRLQFGLSSDATADWFASVPARYYLVGFSHAENVAFDAPLLRAMRPRAVAYVLNVDMLFDRAQSDPGRAVMHEAAAKSSYEQKGRWEIVHRAVCTAAPALCGSTIAFFRSRSTGAWALQGGQFTRAPVSYVDAVNADVVAAQVEVGAGFLSELGVPASCVILTMVPTVDTPIGNGKAIARRLGGELVAPELSGLETFDKSHLGPLSAQRWSAAFLEAASERIRKCLAASVRNAP